MKTILLAQFWFNRIPQHHVGDKVLAVILVAGLVFAAWIMLVGGKEKK